MFYVKINLQTYLYNTDNLILNVCHLLNGIYLRCLRILLAVSFPGISVFYHLTGLTSPPLNYTDSTVNPLFHITQPSVVQPPAQKLATSFLQGLQLKYLIFIYIFHI